MQVIVFASQKGGVGKTTLTANLGVAAEIAGDGPAVLTSPVNLFGTPWGGRGRTWACPSRTTSDWAAVSRPNLLTVLHAKRLTLAAAVGLGAVDLALRERHGRRLQRALIQGPHRTGLA